MPRRGCGFKELKKPSRWRAGSSAGRSRSIRKFRDIEKVLLGAGDLCMGVKTIAVIGAGTMGRGIAYAAAFGGYNTVLEDVSRQVLEQGVAWIKQSFEEGVVRGKVEASVRDKALSLISTASNVEDAIRDAELIIEAAPEELEMKLELFTIFDKFAKTGAIFASNTSSLSITDFTDVTVSRDRCVGMHFFNPVPKMKLVELVR